jgi:hypothetical protein
MAVNDVYRLSVDYTYSTQLTSPISGKTCFLPFVSLAGIDGTPAGTSENPTVFGFGPLSSGTDRSGAIALGGTAQQLAAANPDRVALRLQPLTEDMWVNEIGGTAAATTAGSYKVANGTIVEIWTSRAISIVSATTAAKFTATEI